MTNFRHCYFLHRAPPVQSLRWIWWGGRWWDPLWATPSRPQSRFGGHYTWICSKATTRAKLRASEVKSGRVGINQPTSNWLSLNLPRIIFLDVKRTHTWVHRIFHPFECWIIYINISKISYNDLCNTVTLIVGQYSLRFQSSWLIKLLNKIWW